MNNVPKPFLLPEEVELARLEAEQADLKEKVATSELALETAKTEITHFQHRYYQTVGRLYAELDELDARIAKARAKQSPDDSAAKADAKAAEQKAKRSAEEAGLIEAQPTPSPEISPELKQAYRQAIKLMHPDLATTEHERKRRTELMAQVNLAYEHGDLAAIEKLIREYGEDPEAIVEGDVASRIVKAIRRIAQLRRRLDELQAALEAQQKTEIFQLKQTIEEAEANGDDPLGDLAEQLMQEMSERKMRLKPATKQLSTSEAPRHTQPNYNLRQPREIFIQQMIQKILPEMIGIVLLLWAFLPFNPYGYYEFLRLALCGIFIHLAIQSHQMNKQIWLYAFIAAIIVYNPIFMIHLDREIWSAINIPAIVLLWAFGRIRLLQSAP